MRQAYQCIAGFTIICALTWGPATVSAQSPPASLPRAQHPGSTEPIQATEQMIYVPVYSHIYYGGKGHGGKRQYPLSVTLSIRNTDLQKSLTVTSVRYYDTEGRLLQEYLERPQSLGPLVSIDVFVEERDIRGGAGANFLVEWRAEAPVNVPVVEAIMIGISGNQTLSFTSPGRVIRPPTP